ncbi:site-specific integrase [Mesorhizobium sp. M0500]
MSEHLLLAPLLESYFRRRLTKQRNATPATVASYRDALRMLILFAAARLRKKPAALTLEELDRDLVLAFLDELEEKRNNSVATRNARLAAIRSFFHHVAAADPASFGVAQRVLTIPIKRTHIEVTYHLTTAEVDTLIAAPDPQTRRGRRDRAFLLFLARTGARVSEATGVNANDLQLERPHPQVLLRGKGRRDRVVPIPKDLARALTTLLSERGIAHHEPRPIFVGARNERLTRFGATPHNHSPAIFMSSAAAAAIWSRLSGMMGSACRCMQNGSRRAGFYGRRRRTARFPYHRHSSPTCSTGSIGASHVPP